MSRDYFLIHRAVQIQRLCEKDAQNGIEVHGRFSRDGFSKQLLASLRCIDRICKLPIAGDAKGGVMQVLLSLGSGSSRESLTPQQRELIYEFEASLIEVQLSDDPFGQSWAAATIHAILMDRSFFFGLKPLAEHSSEFAYEFLYPTWLNLYTVLRTRDADSAQPKFADDATGEMFSLLNAMKADSHETNLPLVAILTFVANRFGASESLVLARRLKELHQAQGTVEFAATISHLETMEEQASSASAFQALLKNYLIVECQRHSAAKPHTDVGKARCFPPPLATHIGELAKQRDDFGTYQKILLTTGKILEAAGGFDADFGGLFGSDEYDLHELLGMCLSAEEGRPAFSCRIQNLIAQIITMEKQAEAPDPRRVQRFAQFLGRRVDAMDDEFLAMFTEEFVKKDKHRAILLANAHDGQNRGKVAQQLIEAARSEKDVDRFFYLLLVAAVIGTEPDYDGLRTIQRTVTVFCLVRQDESMSRGELRDLVADVRANLPESLNYLQVPIFAGRGKSDRLARMYLALSEACELYTSSGKTGNFGLVRAAYRNLDLLTEDD